MASAPVGFALIDRRLTYLRINETLAEMNGLPVAAHLGRRLREVLHALEPLEELVKHVFDSEEPVLGLRAEVPGPAPGEPRHVLANFHPIRDTSDKVYAVGGIVVDITEQVRAMEEIQRDAAFRERLLAILGHDLLQPLSTISMTAEAWLLQEGLPENLLRSAQRLSRAAARMGRMISDLLDFARVRQQSGLPLTPRPIDLGAVCHTVVEEITMAHPARSIELHTEGLCEGQWDPDRIAQVISNLVSNALAYSPPDTPVTVEVSGTGSIARIAVRNQGAPIAEELLPVLFDPFRRGQHASQGPASKGLGLGLYITREIVRAHGGDLCVRSEPHTGTTFEVELPQTHRPGRSP
ncbi:MAG: PAS domain-containing sensor histidine kinase [Polyangia bacterium]